MEADSKLVCALAERLLPVEASGAADAARSVAHLHKAAGLGRGVELRVHNAGARRHVLHCAAPERLAVAQRVLVRQAAVHHVREDLGVAVRMLPAEGPLCY